MKLDYLIDTNIVLYWFFDSKRLSGVMDQLNNAQVFISPFSLWEIAIKNQIGKLNLPIPFNEFGGQIADCFELLPWQLADIDQYSKLPLVHRDPFDRMIIAQALNNGLRIVSADKIFASYDIDCLTL